MLPEIWDEHCAVMFAATIVDVHSDILGFYFLHPGSRFWELLEMGGITPKRIISAEEAKALAEGHKDGSLSDPVRTIFIQKKTSQLLRLGIGLTALNRRVVAQDEKDRTGIPGEEDVSRFIGRMRELAPRIVALAVHGEVFARLFGGRFPAATKEPGLQSFAIGNSEVWLLGSTSGKPRGEALAKQEDAFFNLGERVQTLREGSGGADT